MSQGSLSENKERGGRRRRRRSRRKANGAELVAWSQGDPDVVEQALARSISHHLRWECPNQSIPLHKKDN